MKLNQKHCSVFLRVISNSHIMIVMNSIHLVMDMASILAVVSASIMVVYFLRLRKLDKTNVFQNNF
jgi:hypothetical protein